jgi:hypothetical protein
MAFQTADKQKTFGSRFRQKKYDQHHPAEEEGSMKKMAPDHEKQESPEFEAGEQEGQVEGSDEMNQNEAPQSVVGAHGKATSVHVAHDHGANQHHVTSTHADGHVHKSSHASSKDAHQAAGMLGGAEENPAEQNPEDAMLGGEPEGPESDGFRMPRLA